MRMLLSAPAGVSAAITLLLIRDGSVVAIAGGLITGIFICASASEK